MEHSERTYLPAAGRHWMLPLYDTMVWIVGGNASRRKLVEQADIKTGQRVLEIGCGTGSIPVLIKKNHPGAEVVGLDPDSKALAIGKQKAQRAGVKIEFDQGFSDHLPYADASFDRVLSSFMFHHLKDEERASTLAEIRRVLKAGGSFHLLDFVPARSGFARVIGHLFHGRHDGRDHEGGGHDGHHVRDRDRGGHDGDHDHGNHARIEADFISLLKDAGFIDAAELDSGSTLVGTIAYFRSRNP